MKRVQADEDGETYMYDYADKNQRTYGRRVQTDRRVLLTYEYGRGLWGLPN